MRYYFAAFFCTTKLVLSYIFSSSALHQHTADCTCFAAARQRYLGVDTLKELFENVEGMIIIIQDFYSAMESEDTEALKI